MRVSALWRHPIKSHGREALDRLTLIEGQTVPWDRHWAVTHEASKYEGAAWAPCANFMIGTRFPTLAGIDAALDVATRTLTLTHRDRPALTFSPDTAEGAAAFLDWVAPLIPEGGRKPVALRKAPQVGLTDTPFPSVSVMSTASHRAVEGRLGRALEPERWRGNIWFEGAAPWEEFEWIGREITVGTARLRIEDRIERCKHTMANPVTGQRDTDTLGLLQEGWGHTDFGIYGVVTQGGDVALQDEVRLS